MNPTAKFAVHITLIDLDMQADTLFENYYLFGLLNNYTI